jgi:sulfate/thiosulfate-binding protein
LALLQHARRKEIKVSKHRSKRNLWQFALAAGLTLVAVLAGAARAQTNTLLNVSYDPTRELYREITKAFNDSRAKAGLPAVAIRTSHGGSGGQARAVIDGLDADIVTLALSADIDAIADRSRRIAADWKTRFPNNATPFTSTIVFLVRAGNPKGIKDWDDLVKPGVQVITPNPKTSGGARWNYLAAWGYAARAFNNDETKIRDFIGKLYKNAPVLDSGARGSTITFAQRGVGDVLIAWENDALLADLEFGKGKFEIVAPSVSIVAETPVAIVDANVDRKGTRELAQSFLSFLWSDAAQAIAAKNYYRPVKTEAARPADLERFAKLDLLKIDADFGGWAKVQATHFAEKAIFDQIYQPAR